jgi:hypothetical protein
MASNSTETKDSSDPPAPEVLKSQSEAATPASGEVKTAVAGKIRARLRRGTYRPSHRATFIGLAVIIVILAINGGVIYYFLNGQTTTSSKSTLSDVTISPAVLDGLGVSRNAIGNSGTELVVGPNSRFNGTVTIGSDVSIAGQLTLNSKFSASDASLKKLQAGDTSISQLNVNGDGTVSNFNLRNDLSVVGATRLQGPVTVSQLLTVNNSLNVSGNLAVGGTLSARGFQASSLISDTTLTVGGHILTQGLAPGVSPGGSALGSNGTVSVSGNDASGTVAANIGVGAGSGLIVQVSFRNRYVITPHVVITPIGRSAGDYYVNRTSTGFTISVATPLSPGGYAFDYIVMQ